jgi:hypothetical protein
LVLTEVTEGKEMRFNSCVLAKLETNLLTMETAVGCEEFERNFRWRSWLENRLIEMKILRGKSAKLHTKDQTKFG